ncbi:MAG: hypothetical protein JRN57_03960 [Nitrososphaerota archaeon]|nr:hypothetical protein [Nitrososphaerota archaeon]
MKPRTPRGIWALRVVTVTVALAVVVVAATVAYSAYEDYSGFRSGLSAGNKMVVGNAVYDQATGAETISFNVTVPNRGLYPLNVSISCSSASPSVQCRNATSDILPGQQGVLHFSMTVADVQQFLGSADRQINGTVAMTLAPFASLSVGVNFTSFVRLPGGA